MRMWFRFMSSSVYGNTRVVLDVQSTTEEIEPNVSTQSNTEHAQHALNTLTLSPLHILAHKPSIILVLGPLREPWSYLAYWADYYRNWCALTLFLSIPIALTTDTFWMCISMCVHRQWAKTYGIEFNVRNIECMQRALLSVKVCTTNRVLSGELQVATAKRNASASVKNVIFRIKPGKWFSRNECVARFECFLIINSFEQREKNCHWIDAKRWMYYWAIEWSWIVVPSSISYRNIDSHISTLTVQHIFSALSLGHFELEFFFLQKWKRNYLKVVITNSFTMPQVKLF